jgi:predicted RNase H-like HicB family nuclease
MATAIKSGMELHIVFYCEDEDWYGHCLEFDLAESGDSVDDAKRNILDVIRAHVEYAVKNDNMEYLFKSAPMEYWKRFWTGKPMGVEHITIEDTDDFIPSTWKLKETLQDPDRACA